MAFTGGVNPNLAFALANQVQRPQVINTGPTRSELVQAFLQQQQRPQQVQSVGEGFARLGSDLVNAIIGKKAIDERLAQNQALAQQQADQSARFSQAAGVAPGFTPDQTMALVGIEQNKAKLAQGQVQWQAEQQAKAAKAAADAAKEAERIKQQELENRLRFAADERAASDAARKQAVFEAEQQAKTPEGVEKTAKTEFEIKEKLAAPQAIKTYEGMRSGLQRQIDLVDDLIKHPSRESATGWFDQSWLSPDLLEGTRDFNAKFNTLKSSATLNELADAKRRGITFGALSEKEMRTVGEAAATLDPSTGDESALKQLQAYKNRLENAFNALGNDIEAKRKIIGLNAEGEDQKRLKDMSDDELILDIYR